jgi:5-methylcytosine-specific restriction endonuclease McrA
MARLFSKKQRYSLFLISGGKCNICGCDLTSDNFHADHKKPHSKGGDTDLLNGQALCRACNLKKGNKYDTA